MGDSAHLPEVQAHGLVQILPALQLRQQPLKNRYSQVRHHHAFDHWHKKHHDKDTKPPILGKDLSLSLSSDVWLFQGCTKAIKLFPAAEATQHTAHSFLDPHIQV